MAEFHKKGEVTDHVATADITGGQLILLANGQVGLAPVDIADTKTDSLQTQGFISIPKLDGQQIKAGLPVGYDADADPADGVAGSGPLLCFWKTLTWFPVRRSIRLKRMTLK